MNELSIAENAVKKAGELLRRNFRKKYSVERKEKHDFVTGLDLKAEKRILEILEDTEYSIYGEETGEHPGEGGTWIVDPLDGTTNYILGSPAFASAVSLVIDGKPELSAAYLPFTDDIVTAERGGGAYLNGERITVSDISTIEDSFLIFCHGKDPEDSRAAVEIYSRFKTRCKDLRQLGSAVFEFLSVALGRAEAFIFPGAPKYDVAPGYLFLEEAGGRITDFEGEEYDFDADNMLASNGNIHDRIIGSL
ncbi:MAG: inositol monophosphatase family protein [Candidatus Nanohaloarchaea archaeon]|nr:inositol monophosphatase family protein [Candidatus Nanohaloarchaea archaeon]